MKKWKETVNRKKMWNYKNWKAMITYYGKHLKFWNARAYAAPVYSNCRRQDLKALTI